MTTACSIEIVTIGGVVVLGDGVDLGRCSAQSAGTAGMSGGERARELGTVIMKAAGRFE